ncbi:MAG: glycosyltransferase [Deltaproteobacteria bacterium]|nr:glycosyltransferase [Deltaproteobacteria bacterium]
MRVLFVANDDSDYLAKCHEAFRTGLRRMLDVRMFGRGYPGYDPTLTTYAQIIPHIFPDAQPDLIIAELNADPPTGFTVADASGLSIPVATILGDYWNYHGEKGALLASFLEQRGIDLVLSYFLQGLELFEGTPLASRFCVMPPSVDPQIYNDWQQPKIYDVGFLAAGTTEYTNFYPERFQIHERLKSRSDLRYLWAAHPGWGRHSTSHPLVGKNFSKAINSCRTFVTTGGVFRSAHAKYVEILASRTVLLADTPIGAELLGLQDGVNYVAINPDNVEEKLAYLLANPDICERIAEEGYRLALSQHSCYSRALDFYVTCQDFFGPGFGEPGFKRNLM